MRRARLLVVLAVGIVVGVMASSAIRLARADEGGDVHRIAVASERIAHLLNRCPR